ncbi:MAG TPA: UDP-N-acetylmuramoyl-L-alanyl-D-glutamate--2,6-diaminopimelate ligase [Hyphomicrobiaceae bacterium]|jgi:UDP-N-acetylmuramoyl-L-alanyl-D-glutamate--2,6-diaminopimelate ligase
MNLSKLVGPETKAASGCGQVAIAGLTADSREVRPGWLFAALRGSRADGSGFIAEAVARGAAAVLCAEGTQPEVAGGVPLLVSAEPRRALALMAARFYGVQPEMVVAVTGTSGKTSVADFARQIFAALGHTSASLGTIGLVAPGAHCYGSLTSPDPVTLHGTLAELARAGVTHLALEASSHGLDQHRLDGLRLKAAAFTNLGHDHLDYHPSVKAYLAAKLRLFSEVLPPEGVAVVNADSEHAGEVIAVARNAGRRVTTVGRAGETLTLEALEPERFAQRLRVRHAGGTSEVRLPLLGAYQAGNALLAAGLAMATGEAPARVLPTLADLSGVKGRLEVMGQVRGGLVVIDYAHKPDALAAALKALRPFAPGKLVCVFGCGGDRDTAKRPAMGQIAAALADTVIVTDDNPRSEDPRAIRAAILAGAPSAREIGDRAEAILAGSRLLGAGDLLLVAGKGHETGQIVGDTVIPFSDHEVVRSILTEPKVA